MDTFFIKLQAGDPYAIGLLLGTLISLSAIGHFVSLLTLRKWPTVWGRLERADVKSTDTGFGARHSVDVEYHYTVDGQEYTGKRLSKVPYNAKGGDGARKMVERQLLQIERRDDDQVKVHYKPGEPELAYLVVPGKLQAFWTLFCFVGGVAVVGVCGGVLGVF